MRKVNPYWGLAALALSMAAASLGVSAPNVALPDLAIAFDAPFQRVQWVVIAYLLMITTLVVGAGRLGDVMGRRRVLSAGAGLLTVASVACALAPTLWFLIAARAAQGIGASALMALTIAMVGETVPKERTGMAMGLLGTMSAVGTALGPSLGGLLLAGSGWRAIFWLMVPLGAATVILAHRHLPDDAREAPIERKRDGFDAPGAVVLCLSLGAYAMAVTLGRGDFGAINIAALVIAAAGLALFARIERRSPAPLVRMEMFGDSRFAAGLAMNVLVATVIMTTFVVGPFHLSRALGLDAAAVGLVMSVGPVISMVCGVPAGRLVDRLGAARTLTLALASMALGAFGLAASAIGWTTTDWRMIGYVGAIALLTPGYQLFQAANNTAVMADAPKERRGVISGALGLSRNLGLITGASAMGAVFAAASGASDMAGAAPEDVAMGARITFAVAGCLMVAALVVSRWGRHRTGHHESS